MSSVIISALGVAVEERDSAERDDEPGGLVMSPSLVTSTRQSLSLVNV